MPAFSLKHTQMLGSTSLPTSDPSCVDTHIVITADMWETVEAKAAEMPELFLSAALSVSGQNYSLLKELYWCTNFEKVRGRFSYVLVEMDQKWMASTDWSTTNSLPNLAIYLWGTEEAATFKMHFGPYFCSMLQGFFYIQLEAELCEKWHVCLSNRPFRKLPFWCDYMDCEDIWHNDRKWENFYGSAATRQFSIFLPTAANHLLLYVNSLLPLFTTLCR